MTDAQSNTTQPGSAGIRLAPGWRYAALAMAFILAAAMVGWLVYVDLRRPELAQRTDFLNSCYVAGTICARRSFDQLYPPMSAQTEVGSEFTKVAHSLMPQLPAESSPVWQYPPIDAQFFSLFTCLAKEQALIAWQLLGVAAMLASTYMVARAARTRWLDLLCLSIVFFPFFLTLKMGQQGIVFGALPLSAALYFMSRDRPFLAGLCGALSFFTTKYFLVMGFICTILLRLNWRAFAGLAAGCALIFAFMLATVPISTCAAWLHNIHLSEQYFFEPHFAHNLTLYTSLPALLIMYFPIEYRSFARILFYLLAAAVGIITLILGWRVAGSALSAQQKLRIIFALSFYMMPITQPHLLYYDLASIMFANVLLWNLAAPQPVQLKLKAIAITSTMVIDAYFVCFALLNTTAFHPLLFALLLCALFVQLLWAVGTMLRQPDAREQVS